MLAACTDDDAARTTLTKAGYTDIRLRGYDAFACGNEDTTATAFVAKNSLGKDVTGTVCCGLVIKACTIRW
jgi:hypothetical protein